MYKREKEKIENIYIALPATHDEYAQHHCCPDAREQNLAPLSAPRHAAQQLLLPPLGGTVMFHVFQPASAVARAPESFEVNGPSLAIGFALFCMHNLL